MPRFKSYDYNQTKMVPLLFADQTGEHASNESYEVSTGYHVGRTEFRCCVKRLMYRWLNRRSERRGYNWKTFTEMMRHYGLLYPRISWGWERQAKLKLA